MIDIHCHILNSIDDGAENLEMSLEMLKTAKDNGVDKVILTPHIKCSDNVSAFIKKRDELADVLVSEAAHYNCPEIYKGAEIYIDEEIFYSDIRNLSLNDSRYVLCEFDFYNFKPVRVEKYLDEIFSDGKLPVFAHPERYDYCQKDWDFINYLYEKGVLFQINAPSLAGLGSAEEFILSYEMVNKQMAAFIGTDAHSDRNRTTELLKFVSGFPGSLNSEYLDYMLNKAPMLLLADMDIEDKSIGRIKKRNR